MSGHSKWATIKHKKAALDAKGGGSKAEDVAMANQAAKAVQDFDKALSGVKNQAKASL